MDVVHILKHLAVPIKFVKVEFSWLYINEFLFSNVKIHCCEKGYSCDITSKRCIRSFVQPFGLLSSSRDILCPDGITQCPSTTTCCPNKDKDPVSYSCCPYAKGVCCGRNGSICCPNNYQCDETQLSCQLQDSKSLLRNRRQIDIDFHQCGLSDFGCSESQTCCRTYGSSDGDYACCNFPGVIEILKEKKWKFSYKTGPKI